MQHFSFDFFLPTLNVNRESPILQVGRAAYGRSILTPVNIPNQMNIPVDMTPSNEERPHCK